MLLTLQFQSLDLIFLYFQLLGSPSQCHFIYTQKKTIIIMPSCGRKCDAFISYDFVFTEENVTDVTAAVSVKYGVVPYFGHTYNLCKLNILSCPIKAGIGSTVFKYMLVQYQASVRTLMYTDRITIGLVFLQHKKKFTE